jgi:MFS family permease
VPPRYKLGVYALEGINTFACAYYGNYILFLTRDAHGFGNRENLLLGAGHGLVYVFGSLVGGKFGQRRGQFAALRVGFGGMALGMALGALWSALAGQLLAFLVWTVAMCFTWPNLEALASEHEPVAALPHRIGLYNVVWASVAAVAFFTGGAIFESAGSPSLYWLPGALFAVNFAATFPLRRAHDRWLARAEAEPSPAVAPPRPPHGDAKHFLRLAWIANPFAYMAVNTLTAVVPGIAARTGLGIAEAGMVMAVWFIVRAGAFVLLWAWDGWHYRFRWFAGALVMLLASFATAMVTNQIWLLVVAQVFFGLATGLIYYSSLYYAMDGSDTKAEHGGAHEALIGAGICGGPAVGAASLWLAPAAPAAPVVAVGGLLVAGMAVIAVVHRRHRRQE